MKHYDIMAYNRENRVVCLLIIGVLLLAAFLSGCSLKKTCAIDECEREVNGFGIYCSIHGCSFCDQQADEGCSYCSFHRCKYSGRFGQCRQPIIGANADETLKFCDNHKDLDLHEFRKAEDIASDWNLTVAAKARNSLLGPYSFTYDFYTTDSIYYFEVYDVEYGKYGYILVIKENGDLKCDGMRYK